MTIESQHGFPLRQTCVFGGGFGCVLAGLVFVVHELEPSEAACFASTSSIRAASLSGVGEPPPAAPSAATLGDLASRYAECARISRLVLLGSRNLGTLVSADVLYLPGRGGKTVQRVFAGPYPE